MKSIAATLIVALTACCIATRVDAQGQVSGNAFNPAISLILDGKYAGYSRDPRGYSIPGFLLSDEAGLTAEGLSADESEIALSANVDDKFYGFSTISIEQDAGDTVVNLEEAWIETLVLPHGLKVKAGRFLSDIGYLNATHPHTWDFADAPLAYRAMLDSGYGDSGVQLRWVAPLGLYLEVGGELLRGDTFPAAGAADNGGTGADTFFLHVGGDVGASNSWRTGISQLNADATGRESPTSLASASFTGKSRVTIVDFVWKWAKNGNTRDKSFIAQAEYLRRDENGSLSVDGLMGNIENGAYDGEQDGWYAQGVYQFHPRWRVGLRFDRLSASNRVDGPLASGLLVTAHDPHRTSVMVDFSNSEFSRLRLQWNKDNTRQETDDQVFLQYIMSLGAHGAHRF